MMINNNEEIPISNLEQLEINNVNYSKPILFNQR